LGIVASASKIRRWLAGTCLSLSLLMLVLGLTALTGWLANSFQYLIYWTVCICLTVLAAITALLDLLLLRHQLREAQKLLIEQTLRDANDERNEKPNP
jgi:hypothetical protein